MFACVMTSIHSHPSSHSNTSSCVNVSIRSSQRLSACMFVHMFTTYYVCTFTYMSVFMRSSQQLSYDHFLLCVYVYLLVCMYVHVYVCMCEIQPTTVSMYVFFKFIFNVHMFRCYYVCKFTYMYVCVRSSQRLSACIFVHMYTSHHVYTYFYYYVCTFTCICMYEIQPTTVSMYVFF